MLKKISLLLLLGLPVKAEVYQFSSSARAYWGGTKPVQLIIDTEFGDCMVNRVIDNLSIYGFVLKERRNIDFSTDPAENEILVAYGSQYINGGASKASSAFRTADGGINRGVCSVGTADTENKLVWYMIHEILHSVGVDHSQPYRWFEGDKNTRGLMFSNRPKQGFTHDDLRALSEALREDFTESSTITVTGTAPRVFHGVMLNMVNVDDPDDSSQVLLNYTFSDKTAFELKNVKKGRYYITLSPVLEFAGITNQDLDSDLKSIKYHRSKRILNLTENTEIEIRI